MSTFMANKANIERKWYVVDAAGKPLGKTAVIVADLLRGKGKVTYTPHADCGDNVIVINAGKAVLTGNKMEQKYYRTHSGWVGGLKETKYRILMQDKPELAMRVAVRGMMPRTTATSRNRPTRARDTISMTDIPLPPLSRRQPHRAARTALSSAPAPRAECRRARSGRSAP